MAMLNNQRVTVYALGVSENGVYPQMVNSIEKLMIIHSYSEWLTAGNDQTLELSDMTLGPVQEYCVCSQLRLVRLSSRMRIIIYVFDEDLETKHG